MLEQTGKYTFFEENGYMFFLFVLFFFFIIEINGCHSVILWHVLWLEKHDENRGHDFLFCFVEVLKF